MKKFCLALALSIGGIFGLMSNSQASVTRAILTESAAKNRAQQISEVNYELQIDLPESAPEYSGRVEIYFDVSKDAEKFGQDIFLDFSAGGKVQSLKLNGAPVKFSSDGTKLFIPTQAFKLGGANQLQIEFTHPYMNTGSGFHRTFDSADGEYYMFSDFEPYQCNQAFPLFDQPDLKATYKLRVEAVKKWQIISNIRENRVSELSNGKSLWEFPRTEKFSTYLFALMAGPFAKWESKTESGIPLRLFARKSLAKYVPVEDWFHTTQVGFDYFTKVFGYPYHFHKYDQIICPDYNNGAMENVGAVSFSEDDRFVPRSPLTPLERMSRHETILHELAHMWFGNLVTMYWWDDLWLNESFATYAAYAVMAAMREKLGLPDAWQFFHSDTKIEAYLEDGLVTTHPIVGIARDTEDALASFDPITYNKGASALKQFVFYIGEDAFHRGLHAYFKKYAFKSATRRDFMEEMAHASGKNLAPWEKDWFKSSGTNVVQALVEQSQGRIEHLVLKQSPDHADWILRAHATQVGLYDQDPSGKIFLRESIQAEYSGEQSEVLAARGKKVPYFVFPNTDDQDFVHVRLSPEDLDILERSLSKFEDPHLRQMLWQTLWQRVQDSEMPAQRFVRIAMSQLAQEKDLGVFTLGMDSLLASLNFVSDRLRPEYRALIEKFTYENFKNAAPESSEQILLFDHLLPVIHSPEYLEVARRWLDGSEKTAGFEVDQERRWALVSVLARSGAPDASVLIERERKLDQTNEGELHAWAIQARIPEESNKKIWWDRIVGKDRTFGTMTPAQSRQVMAGFHDPRRLELTQFAEDLYFEALPALANDLSPELTKSFAYTMYPPNCRELLDQKSGDFLGNHPELPAPVTRNFKIKRQLQQRWLKARTLSDSSP